MRSEQERAERGAAPDAPWAALDRQAHQVRTPCGDGEMVWRVWGTGGTPLVLLHGGAGSWLHWIRTIPAFAGKRRVVVPDLPGLGGSAAPASGAQGGEIAAIVAAGLESVLGPDVPFDLAGFSFGGVMAGLIAADRRSTRSLTLIGSGGLGVIRNSPPLERVRDKTGADREAAHRVNLGRWMIADPTRIDQLAIAIQDWNSQHARLDSRPIGVSDVLLSALPKVAAPVAGIWGAQDHAVQAEPERPEAVLRGLRPDLRFRIVPDAGHWVAYEAPELFIEALRAVLRPA